MRTAARRAAALAVALLALAAPLSRADPAAAHALLRDSDPKEDQAVARLPDVITLVFTEPLAAVKIAVIGADGADIVSSPPNIRGVGVRQPVRPAPAGRYTVRYEVASADGHPVTGSLAFTVTVGTGPAAPAGSVTPSAPAAGGGAPATNPASVSPGAASPTPTGGLPPVAAPADPPAADGSRGPLIALAVVGVAVLAAATAVVVRRRRRSGTGG